jgi:5-methylcytosine-specific restriction endonuclease McrA
MAQHVLVLNATYEPLNVCSVRRACVLLLKDKAEVVAAADREIRSASATFPHPTVIRLTTYVRAPRLYARKITRKAVFARDGYCCQYCGATSRLTVDHVVPRSRGGGTSWENMVTSCAPCNLRKADRLPHEVGMQPRTRPRPPAPLVFITLAAPEVHPAWELYLGPDGRRLKTATG